MGAEGKHQKLLFLEIFARAELVNLKIYFSVVGFEYYHYLWTEDGPVYGPNGELELDPDIPSSQCGYNTLRVFATCKNNCPGGELSVLSVCLKLIRYNSHHHKLRDIN